MAAGPRRAPCLGCSGSCLSAVWAMGKGARRLLRSSSASCIGHIVRLARCKRAAAPAHVARVQLDRDDPAAVEVTSDV